MSTTLNASTSSGFVQTADTSGTLELQSNGTTQFTVASTGAYGTLKSATAVASTSGTSIDFTSLPSWVKRITVMFGNVSTSSTSNYLIQIGSGSVTSSGYTSLAGTNGGTQATSTAGYIITAAQAAADAQIGTAVISLLGSNTYVCSSNLSEYSGTQRTNAGNGSVTLSGALDRVRITTVNGTDTFDAGSINIIYEG